MDVLLQAVNCAELLRVFAGRSGFGTAKPGRTVDIEVSSQEYVRAVTCNFFFTPLAPSVNVHPS